MLVRPPDPGSLHKYQLIGPQLQHPRWLQLRQWRCLLLMFLLSLALPLAFWSFQSGAAIGSSTYKFEQFDLVGSNSTLRLSPAESQRKAEKSPLNTRTNSSFGPHTSPFSPVGTTLNHDESCESQQNLTTIPAKFAVLVPKGNNAANQSMCSETPSGLVGPIPVWLDAPDFGQLRKLYPSVRPGGHGWPEKCRARHRVAIIVPYRDREKHLRMFLHNLHFLLAKQQMDYAIFIVQQAANQTFNRGKLLNVGFREALRLYDWQCFVFHDVDLLPEDDRNLYSCPQQPRHMSVAVDKFHYRLPYAQIFGGATAMTREQFEQINGFSNDYWGWGGEDDDISKRITYAGYTISRYPADIGRYKMIKHTKESMNPVNELFFPFGCRWAILKMTKQRWHRDGLSSLDYSVLTTHFSPLYTNITVDLLETESRKKLSSEHIKKGC